MKQTLQRMLSPAPDTRISTAARETVVLWLACTIPTIALVTCFKWLFPALFAGDAKRTEYFLETPRLIGLVTWGPALETIGLALLVWVLRKALGPDRKVSLVLLSAAVWAVIHSTEWVAWGLGVFWPFIVFTTAFVRWEPRGLMPALVVAYAVHAMHNASALLITAIVTRF